MHGIVCNCTVLNVIALYCMVLHGPKLHWYCNYDLEWLMWHWCCAEWKSEKVTCLACWIYTGTLWHKELLSELTERRLGMWVVYIHIEHCVHYVFSCPADSSIGDLVTHWVTEWVRDLLKNTTTEWPQRFATLETFDEGDDEKWLDPPKKWQKQIQRQRQLQRHIHLENSIKE